VVSPVAQYVLGRLPINVFQVDVVGEKKVELIGRERDIGLREAVSVEAQSWGLKSPDNHEELMELVELWKLLEEV
jgi:hypothetical protein